jgi:hypothetical protein
MIRDYRYGWHEARSTFGNGVAGQKLDTIERHLTDQSGKIGLCGATAEQYAIYSWLGVVERITKAPVCWLCVVAGKAEEFGSVKV